MSELRYHPFLGQWVITATHRQDRTFHPPPDFCPLCPTKPGGFPTEIPRAEYDIAVFENRFPSLSPNPPEPAIEGTALMPVRPSAGVCEVVCYSQDHDATFATLPLSQVRKLVRVWKERYVELAARPEVEYVFIFENKGKEIGVTLSHPHGQIYAYPFIPPTMAIELENERRHFEVTGRILTMDWLEEELRYANSSVAGSPDDVQRSALDSPSIAVAPDDAEIALDSPSPAGAGEGGPARGREGVRPIAGEASEEGFSHPLPAAPSSRRPSPAPQEREFGSDDARSGTPSPSTPSSRRPSPAPQERVGNIEAPSHVVSNPSPPTPLPQRGEGSRIIRQNSTFVAVIPFFARWPYEVWVAPRRHLPSLAAMGPAELDDLASILHEVAKAYDALFGFSMPYILAMKQEPATPGYGFACFRAEFYPPYRTETKLKYLAGSEAGAGAYINDTLAEDRAERFRAT